MSNAFLILEDGTVIEGKAFGAPTRNVGEVVFNTSMSGYHEILTDPSYAGQIVTLTQPHIGNYGVNVCDMESSKIHAAGLIVREVSELPSNFRSDASLSAWLGEHGVPGISGVDTRSLTRRIREGGVTMGLLASHVEATEIPDLQQALRRAPSYDSQDFVSSVTVDAPQPVRLGERPHGTVVEVGEGHGAAHCVVLDFGAKHSILKHLMAAGFRVTRVPHTTSAADILALRPDGVLVSNGPGDPAQLDAQLQTIRDLAQACPTWGICLGHQLISRAYGGETFKLPYGHRGPNQPVQDLRTRRVEMTSQNHGFAVVEKSMPACLEVTHINLNDGTIEGIRHTELPVRAVQYHPEAGPGPNDAVGFFHEFYLSATETR
ncbi:MAG: glutamine-hydrolyzing carbamoyl-phosphate synthase small subunit [bacterium]